jgi:hypothetical protein
MRLPKFRWLVKKIMTYFILVAFIDSCMGWVNITSVRQKQIKQFLNQCQISFHQSDVIESCSSWSFPWWDSTFFSWSPFLKLQSQTGNLHLFHTTWYKTASGDKFWTRATSFFKVGTSFADNDFKIIHSRQFISSIIHWQTIDQIHWK